jgi:hypothetical protein
VLTKFFLFQVVFLLNGHNCLNSRVNKQSFAQVSEHLSISTVQNNPPPIIKPETSETGTENSEAEVLAAEDEEDDLTSFKRHSESDHYATVMSDVLTFSYFLHYVKELSHPDPLSYHSSSYQSYILLGVFRL